MKSKGETAASSSSSSSQQQQYGRQRSGLSPKASWTAKQPAVRHSHSRLPASALAGSSSKASVEEEEDDVLQGVNATRVTEEEDDGAGESEETDQRRSVVRRGGKTPTAIRTSTTTTTTTTSTSGLKKRYGDVSANISPITPSPTRDTKQPRGSDVGQKAPSSTSDQRDSKTGLSGRSSQRGGGANRGEELRVLRPELRVDEALRELQELVLGQPPGSGSPRPAGATRAWAASAPPAGAAAGSRQ